MWYREPRKDGHSGRVLGAVGIQKRHKEPGPRRSATSRKRGDIEHDRQADGGRERVTGHCEGVCSLRNERRDEKITVPGKGEMAVGRTVSEE
jgi:hypothetical protein